ncbi:chloramphenicol-sensitive protein RarD [Chryseomicrobium aureum]|uniref:EamA family transporter RarD n=1 Tax=Chryseomicrobium aureum TaxID=1441723 RepID=UPI0019568801|nr:EamA family transporter RarD [Chryseomicrobium aureum]MBM7706866.1 chloramphenicol-sensitive protein RarD [Chryseomicrobium aureum]
MTTEQKGIAQVFLAYLLWGLMPIYWKTVQHISSDEILASRIVWSFIFTVLLITVLRDIPKLKTDLTNLWADKKAFFSLMIASYLVTANWFTFIFAVNSGELVQTSLGYYINPLISVLLGIVFLGEKLSDAQKAAVGIAAAGVMILTYTYGELPWISLVLAGSFAFYGLIKKQAKVGAITGLAIETFFVLPFAFIYLAYLFTQDSLQFVESEPITMLLLMFSGVATALPLLLYASGTKRIPLYLSGFIQYIAPTIMLVLGVVLYNEPFSNMEWTGFSFIWVALVLFSVSKFIQIKPSL